MRTSCASSGPAVLENEGWDAIGLTEGDRLRLTCFARAHSEPVRLGSGSATSPAPDARRGARCLAAVEIDLHRGPRPGSGRLRTSASPGAPCRPRLRLAAAPRGRRRAAHLPPRPPPDAAGSEAQLHPLPRRVPGARLGLDNMYHWKRTIGPRHEREQIRNVWGYHQSRQIGYVEYFELCLATGATPVPIVAAGVCCQNTPGGGVPIPDSDDGPVHPGRARPRRVRQRRHRHALGREAGRARAPRAVRGALPRHRQRGPDHRRLPGPLRAHRGRRARGAPGDHRHRHLRSAAVRARLRGRVGVRARARHPDGRRARVPDPALVPPEHRPVRGLRPGRGEGLHRRVRGPVEHRALGAGRGGVHDRARTPARGGQAGLVRAAAGAGGTHAVDAGPDLLQRRGGAAERLVLRAAGLRGPSAANVFTRSKSKACRTFRW